MWWWVVVVGGWRAGGWVMVVVGDGGDGESEPLGQPLAPPLRLALVGFHLTGSARHGSRRVGYAFCHGGEFNSCPEMDVRKERSW